MARLILRRLPWIPGTRLRNERIQGRFPALWNRSRVCGRIGIYCGFHSAFRAVSGVPVEWIPPKYWLGRVTTVMKLWMLFAFVVAAAVLALCLGATAADLTVGLASGVLAAWAWASVDISRRRTAFREKLKAIEGMYRVRRKGEPDSDLGTVTLSLEGTVIRTSSPGNDSSAGSWEGQLEMSESLPNIGEGTYAHSVSDGWGFHTVQVRGKEILVHAEFVRKGAREREVHAYVWKPIPEEPPKLA